MSNYSIQASPGWDVRDALTTGATGKTISATDFHNEFTAIVDAIDDKADLASPELTGTPKATTASAGANTDQLATTQFVTRLFCQYNRTYRNFRIWRRLVSDLNYGY